MVLGEAFTLLCNPVIVDKSTRFAMLPIIISYNRQNVQTL